MMRLIPYFILAIIGIINVMPAYSDTKNVAFINVKYAKSTKASQQALIKNLKKEAVAESVADIINEIFIPKKTLTLSFGGKDGPLYDNETSAILIPYDFIDEVSERFKDAKYAESGISINDATMDALTHTLLHELGHAFIDIYDLPIVSKEEDAADSLATMLLIENFEDGEEMAQTAADLFDLESDDIKAFEEKDFWDEHSLDVQRYYNTICHIYGSAPKEYASLKKDAEFSDERAELCVDEYEQLYFGWMALLKPYLKAEDTKDKKK